MATIDKFISSFPADEQLSVQYFQSFSTVPLLNFFTDIYNLSEAEIKASLIAQQTGPDANFLTGLGTYFTSVQATVIGSTDQEKWASFLNGFEPGLRPAIQVMVDYFVDNSVTYDDFVDNSFLIPFDFLDTDSPLYNFWDAYAKFMKNKANTFLDNWIVFENSLKDSDYKDQIKFFDNAVQDHHASDSLSTFKNFIERKAFGDILDAIIYHTTNGAESYGGYAGSFVSYLAYIIKQAADFIIDASEEDDDIKEQKFYNTFRAEYQDGIKQLIDDFKTSGFITDFSDLADRGAQVTLPGITLHQAADATHPQITSFNRPMKVTFNDFDTYWSSFTHPPAAGDKIVMKLNNTVLSVSAPSDPNDFTTLVNAINDATGDWSNITATGTTSLTYSSNNTPFTFESLSVYDKIQSILAANPSHPMFYGLAQAYYNDAAGSLMDITEKRALKGKLLDSDSIPLTNHTIKVYDIDDPENALLLGTTTSDDNGYFSFTYIVSNPFIENKNLRLEIFDASGNTVGFSTSKDTNLFTDATSGTFETGTAPNYTEWNLTLGTDIKIGASEKLGNELLTNGDFSQKGGWLSSGQPFPSDASTYTTFSSSQTLQTNNVLTPGKKYRLAFDLRGYFYGSTATISFPDSTSTSIGLSSPDVSIERKYLDFVSPGSYISMHPSSGTLIDNVSVKELIDYQYEGKISPRFYLDNTAFTDDFILTSNTAYSLEENTDYEISAYVFFNSPIVTTSAAAKAGLLLAPSVLSVNSLESVEITNGINVLTRATGVLTKSEERSAGLWHKISTIFNSGEHSTSSIQVKLDDTNASLSDYLAANPGFSFSIDEIVLRKAQAVSADLSLQKPSSVADIITVIVDKFPTTLLNVTTTQVADSSHPQISNITPENPEIGDVVIMSLNGKNPVSFKVTTPTIASVTAGLTAAATAESALLAITQNQAASTSAPQITYLTPSNVKVGAKFSLTKTMKNLWVDGDQGTFEDSADGSGNPPSDWGITKGAGISDFTRSTTAYSRGAHSASITLVSSYAKGETLLFSSSTAINLKKRSQYKISALVRFTGTITGVYANKAEMYILPTGFSRNNVVSLSSYAIQPSDPVSFKKIETVFNSGENGSLTFSFLINLFQATTTASGAYLIDEIRLEEVPAKTSVLQYVATAATVANVTAGLTAVIKSASADLTLAISQPAGLSQSQLFTITPANVVVGAVYTLELNENETVSFTATAATVANVTLGLKNAIAAKTTGDWMTVTATDNTTYLTVTAKASNAAFILRQKGGEWSDVSVSDASTYVAITGLQDDAIFEITQQGGGWNSVATADHSTYLSITANSNNVPFSATTKVIKTSDNIASNAISMSDLMAQTGIVLSPELSNAISLKDIYNLDDVLALGGLKNNLDGQLVVEYIRNASSGVSQMIHISPVNIEKGDIYILQINNFDTLTYVSTDGTLAEVVSGLIAAINAASGDWDKIYTGWYGSYISFGYTDVNVPFTFTQLKAADNASIKKIDALASLHSVSQDLGLADEKFVPLMETLIEEGYTDALSIAGASQTDFINIANKIIGDFNAARMYELAGIRKTMTDQIANQFLASSASYTINKTASPVGTQLSEVVGEQCYCDDCEAAVSPLAYLIDLTNYVIQNIRERKTLDGNLEHTSYYPVFTLESLENTFHQKFNELPASCDDINNTVCQPRIAIEILRRYLAITPPDEASKSKMTSALRDYMFTAYKYFLQEIGTSYNEVRVTRTEADKIALAQKIGFNYDENKDFLDKLFIQPKAVTMSSWADYLSIIPGGIQTLISTMISNFNLHTTFTFDDFVNSDLSSLRSRMLTLSTSSDGFYQMLAKMMIDKAKEVNSEVDALNIPKALKEDQKWDKWVYDLSNTFSMDFYNAFQTVNALRSVPAGPFSTMAQMAALSTESLATTLTYMTSVPDFWTPFSVALQNKLEEFYLSEREIEELFGLSDTRKDVFSDGAKFGDDANILARWTIRGVNWGQNTDANGYIYLYMDEVDGVIRLFNKPERHDPEDIVGVATLDPATNKFIIVEYADSGLTGELIATGLDASSYIYISAVPLYMSWQLKSLRQNWLDQEALSDLPVVDPDLIAPGDIKFPYGINLESPDMPIDLWQARKNDLATKLTGIAALRNNAIKPDCTHAYTNYGSSGSGSTQLSDARDIAVDSHGVAYIADYGNNRIQKLDGSTISTLLSITEPRAVLITPDDKLIVLATGVVKQYTTSGTLEWTFGTSGADLGEFTDPRDLALSKQNELYVTDNVTDDTNTGRIQRFTLPVDFAKYTQAAALTIFNVVEKDTDVKQVTQVVPSKMRVGDTFTLTLGGTKTVSYIATDATPENVTAGLINAIAKDGTWTGVTVTNQDSYLEFTATTANTAFILTYDATVSLDTTDFVAADQSGNFFVNDKINSRILKLNANGEVIKVIGTPHRFTDGLKAMYRFDEAVSGIPDLSISLFTAHDTGVPEVTNIKPVNVVAGTKFRIQVQSTWSEYTATSASIAELTAGLTAQINLDSSATVTAVDMYSYIQITAVANNVAIAYAKEMQHYVRDSSYNSINHNASIVGTPLWTSIGKIGGAVVLNKDTATGQAITVASDSELDASDQNNRTIELWFKADQKDSSDFQILYKQGDSSKGLNAYINKGKIYAGLYDGTDNSFLSGKKLLANTWQHLVIVYESAPATGNDKFRMYLDGVLTDSSSVPTKVHASASPNGLNMGALVNGSVLFHDASTATTVTSSCFFKGSLDNVRIWNRALDPVEVNNLFTRIEDSGNTLFIPQSITVDATGNIFVTDLGLSTVHKLDPDGNFLLKFGGYGLGNLLFKNPIATAVDADNNIYVLDKENNYLQKVNPQAAWSYTVGQSGMADTEFRSPSSLTLDSAGFIYIADTENDRIKLLEPQAGNFISKWESYQDDSGTQSFDTPLFITKDGDDHIIVLTTDNVLVRLTNENDAIGFVMFSASSPWAFSTASALSVGIDGYVYLALSTNQIRRFRFPQEITSVLLAKGILLDQPNFRTLAGIDVDQDGNLVVADVNNHRILKLTSAGYYVASIGKEGEASGTGEGEFNHPYGIATDESSNIYVTDADNNRIQKFNTKGEFLREFDNDTTFGSTLGTLKGIFIDRDRVAYTVSHTSAPLDHITQWDAMHGLGAVVKDQYIMNTSIASLLELNRKENEGDDITDDLSALYIDLRSYRYLLSIIDFAEYEDELLDDYVTDILDIMLQVYKNRLATSWKAEEAALNISLSQDFFKTLNNADENALVFNDWRATKRNRKDWTDKLNARIDQENALWQAQNDMVENAEDDLYISLRDILLAATSFTGTSLAEKAATASDTLLVDFKNNCCQRTTRISQAFETLQGMMWGLRNGLVQDTYPTWILDNNNFDDEWTWMGSYANWRAAQFVFMYPENLLLPSFVTEKTSGFSNLIDEIRVNPQLNASYINSIAQEYYSYYSDIATIQLKAIGRISTFNPNTGQAPYATPMLHLFGLAQNSQTLYWTTVDLTGNGPGELCASWQPVDALASVKVLNVFGAEAYKNKDSRSFLVLFLYVQEISSTGDKVNKFVTLKLDPATATWDKDFAEISVPGFSNKDENDHLINIVINKTSSYQPQTNITLTVQRGTRAICYAMEDDMTAMDMINNDQNTALYGFGNAGNSYAKDNDYISSPNRSGTYTSVLNKVPFDYIPVANIHGMVLTDIIFDNAYTGHSTLIYRGLFEVTSLPALNNNFLNVETLEKYLSPTETNIRMLLFYNIDTTTNGQRPVYYRVYDNSGATLNGTDRKLLDNASFVAMYKSNATTDDYANNIIYQDGNLIKIKQMVFNPTTNTYSDDPRGAAPKVISLNSSQLNYDPTNSIATGAPASFDKMAYMKSSAKRDYLNNFNNSKYIFRFVEEAYYLVPMLIAQTYQKRGLYTAALDWFKYVYNYTAQESSGREIYYGLIAESSKSHILDDFDKTRPAVLSLADKSTTVDQYAVNPNTLGLNPNQFAAKLTVSKAGAQLIYKLPDDNTIDFSNPQFGLDIFDTNFVALGATTVTITATSSGGGTTYAKYTADTTGKAWERLTFTRGSVVKRENIKELRLSFELKSGTVNTQPKVFYINNFVSGQPGQYKKASNWLSNPIDPHAIAATRDDSYLKYTILSIAQCMLAYADSEYTQDTAETVPKARLLYEEALDLLDDHGLRSAYDDAIDSINQADLKMQDLLAATPEWKPVWEDIQNDMQHVGKKSDLDTLIKDITSYLIPNTGMTIEQKLSIIRTEVNALLENPTFFNEAHASLATTGAVSSDFYMTINADPSLQKYINTKVALLSQNYLDQVKSITGVKTEVLLSDQIFSGSSILGQLSGVAETISDGEITPDQITGNLDDIDEAFLQDNSFDPTSNQTDAEELKQFLLKDLKTSLANHIQYTIQYVPSTNFNFCVPPNPVVAALRLKAELNLFKIRNCRNIAGVVRELDPFAAPTDATTGLPQIGAGGTIQLPGTAVLRPTIYRYATLIEKAKQLVQLAQQIEASMLASLEKLDAEQYSLLKANQDLKLSQAGIKLQDLQVKEAQDGIDLANLQQQRAQIQSDGLQAMIDAGLNQYEEATIDAFNQIAQISDVLATIGAAQTVTNAVIGASAASIAGVAAALAAATATTFLSIAQVAGELKLNDANKSAQVNSIYASFARRVQDWQYQKSLADQDIKIGAEQVKIANDQLAVTGQQRQIAQITADNSQATVDFLTNKFTNAELYDWMSGILEDVYAFFLQQATAVAKQAQNQLAFERQEVPSDFIKGDYWSAPVDNLLQSGSGDDKSVDRKGLTGSERLLQDIYQLDQYAFNTDKRKLELTKTFSLASLFPSEFQQFKETGELDFATSMQLFDRDFPGHYLRLIRKVSISVIALVPPNDGIRATLSSSGVSYAVTGGDSFQKVPVVRDPEMIALTGTMNATGMFDLAATDKLFPFENTGVEGKWIFSMPKASNFFDYTSIADILFTMDYTALNDNLYRMQVIDDLDVDIEADMPFSFRNQFADQWYDLCNAVPAATDKAITATFTTSQQDFPVNIHNLKIKSLLMYFSTSDDLDESNPSDLEIINQIKSLPVQMLSFTPKGTTTPKTASGATAKNAIINSDKPNGTTWSGLTNIDVNGTWQLSLDPNLKSLFRDQKITDILFVITYSGEAAAWPKAK